jgi:hypothetical protein
MSGRGGDLLQADPGVEPSLREIRGWRECGPGVMRRDSGAGRDRLPDRRRGGQPCQETEQGFEKKRLDLAAFRETLHSILLFFRP